MYSEIREIDYDKNILKANSSLTHSININMIHVQRRKKVTGLVFHENRKEIKTKKIKMWLFYVSVFLK